MDKNRIVRKSGGLLTVGRRFMRGRQLK